MKRKNIWSKVKTRAAAFVVAIAVIGGNTVLPAVAVSPICATPTASQADASTVTAKAYQDWKESYVVPAATGQLRVQRSAIDAYDTVSEGIAYGMLFAVYSNDKATFDGLWNYAQAHTNKNGVMNWRIAASGTTTGFNGATDADEDMAAALVAADTQWGGYKADATKLIAAIKKYEVEPGTYVLKPGDAWGGSELLNPSYLTPSYYSVFAQYTGDNSWNNVKAASYKVLQAISKNSDSKTTGFIPDWSRADGGRASGMSYEYGYDGSRAPLRIAMASAWDCDAEATGLLDALNTTNQALKLTNLASSYSLDGKPTAKGSGTPLLAAAATAAMASSDASYRNHTWSTLASTEASDYFSDSMRLFGLFVAGGSLVNPLQLKPVAPVTQPSAPVSVAPKTFSISAASSSAYANDIVTTTVAVKAPADVSGALVDLEVYDQSGARVSQVFYENQALSSAPRSYDVKFTATTSGTYTIRGGVFSAGWATNLTWNNAVSAVTVTARPVVTTPEPAPTTPPVAPLPVVQLPVPEPIVVVPTPITPVAEPAPTPVVSTPVAVTPQPAATTQPAVPVVAPAPTLSIWWPGGVQTVHGTQPFKAVLDSVSLSSYQMFWQVDGGTLNALSDSYTDVPHKESLVNLSPWNWRSNQRYSVNFVAKTSAGEVIAQKAVVITVGH